MTEEGREGLRNIGLTGLWQSFRFILLAVTAVTIPRLFGPDAYGRFSTVMAIVSMLFVFSVLGLRFAELRFLAPLFRSGNIAEATILASSIINLRLIAGLVAALFCAFWVSFSGLADNLALPVMVGLFALARYWLEAARGLLLPLGQVSWYIGIDLSHLSLSLCALSIGYVIGELAGAFFAAALVSMLLFYTSVRRNTRILSIGPGRIDWLKMWSVFPYCVYSLLSALFIALRVSMPVWFLSLSGELNQVAYLGVSVQILVSLEGLFTVAWQSLMPILSTMQENREHQRLIQWISLLMRVLAAFFTITTIFWAAVGEILTTLLLGTEYLYVYPCVTMMLLSAAGFTLGACSSGLLMLRKRAGLSTLNYLVFFLSTLAGVVWLYSQDLSGDAYRMSSVYAVSSIAFFMFSYTMLGISEKTWIPIGRVIILFIPISSAPLMTFWEAGMILKLSSSLAYITFYLAGSLLLRLISWSEIRYATKLYRS